MPCINIKIKKYLVKFNNVYIDRVAHNLLTIYTRSKLIYYVAILK